MSFAIAPRIERFIEQPDRLPHGKEAPDIFFSYAVHRRSGLGRIHLVGAEAEFGDCCLGALRIEAAIAGKPRKRGAGDRFGVDFEVAAKMLTVVAASEAIRAE